MAEYSLGNSNLINLWGNEGTITEPAETYVNAGWLAGTKPPPDFMNWVHNLQEGKINHCLAKGIPEWNTSTEYTNGATIQYSGELYKSVTTNTNSIPTRASTDWQPLKVNYTASDGVVSLTENVNEATLDISVDTTGLLTKFEDSTTVEWDTNTSTITANTLPQDKIRVVDELSYTVAVNANGKFFYMSNGIIGQTSTINLPDISSLPDNWRIFIDLAQTTETIQFQAQGSDLIFVNGFTNSYFTFKGFKNKFLVISNIVGAANPTYIFDGVNDYSLPNTLPNPTGFLPHRVQNYGANGNHGSYSVISWINQGGLLEVVIPSIQLTNGTPTTIEFGYEFESGFAITINSTSNVTPVNVNSVAGYSGNNNEVVISGFVNNAVATVPTSHCVKMVGLPNF